MIYPTWNYHRHGLTQSFINKFLECRRQCYLEYIEGWMAKEEPMWFNFGHHIHYVLENVYNDYKPPLMKDIDELLKKYQQIRFYSNEKERVSPEKHIENQLIYETARQLLKVYFHNYQQEFKLNWLHT